MSSSFSCRTRVPRTRHPHQYHSPLTEREPSWLSARSHRAGNHHPRLVRRHPPICEESDS
jgi:hypothetical protein